eukprot:scaffold6079_cov210-Pinguiococcus_pyrenoidosus.AAC.2
MDVSSQPWMLLSTLIATVFTAASVPMDRRRRRHTSSRTLPSRLCSFAPVAATCWRRSEACEGPVASIAPDLSQA